MILTPGQTAHVEAAGIKGEDQRTSIATFEVRTADLDWPHLAAALNAAGTTAEAQARYLAQLLGQDAMRVGAVLGALTDSPT